MTSDCKADSRIYSESRRLAFLYLTRKVSQSIFENLTVTDFAYNLYHSFGSSRDNTKKTATTDGL